MNEDRPSSLLVTHLANGAIHMRDRGNGCLFEAETYSTGGLVAAAVFAVSTAAYLEDGVGGSDSWSDGLHALTFFSVKACLIRIAGRTVGRILADVDHALSAPRRHCPAGIL